MKKLNFSEDTSVGLPLKNLLSLIGAIIVGSYFAFGVFLFLGRAIRRE